MHVKAGWKSALKAGGEQSVTLTGTAEMQLWCAGNWDTLPLVSVRVSHYHNHNETTTCSDTLLPNLVPKLFPLALNLI